MDIRNFTDSTVRCGEHPCCIDITNIKGYHSDYGVFCHLFSYGLPDDPIIQLRENNNIKNAYILIIAKWEEQLEKLPEYVGKIVFDSREYKRKES